MGLADSSPDELLVAGIVTDVYNYAKFNGGYSKMSEIMRSLLEQQAAAPGEKSSHEALNMLVLGPVRQRVLDTVRQERVLGCVLIGLAKQRLMMFDVEHQTAPAV